MDGDARSKVTNPQQGFSLGGGNGANVRKGRGQREAIVRVGGISNSTFIVASARAGK